MFITLHVVSNLVNNIVLHFWWLALKGFCHDVFLMTRATQTKASYAMSLENKFIECEIL